ncbi:MAG: 50S ribosomal protein L24 [Proteobacteria bacterium]|nr:50S ribosomal protein L24 [Pseudomonadota bacterium]NBX85765.1 50S ribosomal protein L24 [Pseudomonadota bacterium]
MQNVPSTRLQSKLKKGDEVIVISGKDKGKSGKIISVITATNRVLVEGVKLVKKHLSAQKAMARQQQPGVIQKETSIAVSNVMLKDPKTGKPTRVGYRVEADGSKVRVAKASGTVIDTVKKSSSDNKKSAAKAPKAKAQNEPKTSKSKSK